MWVDREAPYARRQRRGVVSIANYTCARPRSQGPTTARKLPVDAAIGIGHASQAQLFRHRAKRFPARG